MVIWWLFCMHKYSCQSISKHVYIMVIITDYKSDDFYLKKYHIAIEYLVSLGNSNRSKYCIMYQLKTLKRYIYYRNQHLDDMSNIYDNNNVFSMISSFVLRHKIYHR